MSDARTYVSSMVEESLGLVRGHLDRHPLPGDFVDLVSSTMRGRPLEDVRDPVLEERMVSLLAEMKQTALTEDGFFVRKARWPRAAPFGVCLTHDVDNISRPTSHLWKTRSRFGWGDLLGGLLGLTNPYNNVELIAKREQNNGFRSSFYFMSSNYPLEEVRAISDAIRKDGWDVGLHGDFGTHDSGEKMGDAVSRFAKGLGFEPKSLREHYLKFDFSKSWTVMEGAGFNYDTTVGTNDRLGFKLGLASPFHPPDCSWVPMNLLEIPLVLMDTTLWGYLKRSEQQGIADVAQMTAAVENVEGLLTLLWHQEAVRMKGGRIYWSLLREFKARGCFVASGDEIARWWRSRSVPMVRDGKLIRLGAEFPSELVLRLDVAEGRTPLVDSGTLGGGAGSLLVRPGDRGFKLEIA